MTRGDLLRSGYAAGPASGWSLKALSSKQKSSVFVRMCSHLHALEAVVWDMLALTYKQVMHTVLLGVSNDRR